MAYFYYTRHGETFWNVENKICGATDIGLTERGHEQARELGRKIAEEGIKIDKIICSPLIRAKDTAMHISEHIGIPVSVEPRLVEQNFGRFESTPRDGAEFILAKENFAYDFDGGESVMHAGHRVFGLIEEIKAENEREIREGKEPTIYLLVAHNGIARLVETYFKNMTNKEFAVAGMKNCELRKYEFK